MFVFGHAGLTVAAVRAVDRDVDLRWAVLLAWAPDLIDKPVRHLFPALVSHNTRGFGHTTAFSLLVLAALLLWKRRPRSAVVLWGCYAGHFLLDSMWLHPSPAVLLWPLLGGFPPPVRGPVISWLTLWNVAGEIAGLAVLHRLAKRYGLLERTRLLAYLRSGRLA
ncbi:MAG: metal-dependent hydrolase [Elusimicrobia bacterium]|nr:metal-dependent hydrolase [Elusimicrobiota bacterium]